MNEGRVTGIILCVCVLVMGVLLFFAIGSMSGEGDPPPEGCAWVDMNPSKGADYRLACVPGYFPE